MLDEIVLSRPLLAGIGNEKAHAIELLIAWKNQEPLAGLAAGLIFFFDFVDELAHQVEYAVARPGLFPKIGGGIAGLRGRHGWIASPAEFSSVIGQKARLGSGEVRRDVD